MKTRYLLATLSYLSSLAAAGNCLDSLPAHRAQTESEYLKSDDSPFDAEFKVKFAGFSYFEGDQTYCVEGTFERLVDAKEFQMASFNGKTIPFRKYGVFRFHLDGAARSLSAYQRMDLPQDERQWVLIPFRDRTNGHESYGGGRYLQLDLPIGPSPILDFNRAFNPLCAYDPKFTCPVPPAENWLKMSIPAGEKSYAGNH